MRAWGLISQYRLDKGDWEHIEPSRHGGVMTFTVTQLYEGRHTLEVRTHACVLSPHVPCDGAVSRNPVT